MDCIEWYGYIAWLPLLLWVALFIWFKRCANPLFLKKMVRKGKKWAVLPEYVSKHSSKLTALRLQCVAFSFVVSVLSACSVAWCIGKFQICDATYGFASVVLFLIVAVILYHRAVVKISTIYQAAYYLEYCRARYESDKKGAARNEMDINNRAIWSFTRKLRNAEAHKRLWKYVNAMANSKKIPPDVYAEAMYG